jgi:hypothetical protein
MQRGWVLSGELRDNAAQALRDSGGYFIGKSGKVEKRDF